MTFVGRENIVNTFYTPPIQIKQPFTSSAGLSSVDANLLSGIGDNVAKGVALLTMQNILRLGDGKTGLRSVFSADKQRVAEAALQNYKSRQAAIASSKGWGATQIAQKNKESIDLYIKEIQPLIDSQSEKKAFNEILLSSSSSLTEKLMPVEPAAAPSGVGGASLASALAPASTPLGTPAAVSTSATTASATTASPPFGPLVSPTGTPTVATLGGTAPSIYPAVDVSAGVNKAFDIMPQHLQDSINQFSQVNNLGSGWEEMILNVYNDIFGDPDNVVASEKDIADAKGNTREEKEARVLFIELTNQKKLEESSRTTVQNAVGITDDNVEDMIRQLTDNIQNKRNHQDLSRDTLGSIIVDRKLNTQDEFKNFFNKKDQTKLRTSAKKEDIVAAMKAEAKTMAILENIAYGVIQGEHNGDADKVWRDIKKKKKNFKQQYIDAQAQPLSPSGSQPTTPVNQPQPSPSTPVPALNANGRKRKKNTQNKAKVNLSEIAKILKKYT